MSVKKANPESSSFIRKHAYEKDEKFLRKYPQYIKTGLIYNEDEFLDKIDIIHSKIANTSIKTRENLNEFDEFI